jgi:hypothetical protein
MVCHEHGEKGPISFIDIHLSLKFKFLAFLSISVSCHSYSSVFDMHLLFRFDNTVRATLQSESEGSILARENQRVRLLN